MTASLSDITDEEAQAIGCPDAKCEDLTVCDFCDELVCLEHTVDAVRCFTGPRGPGHHHACASGCDDCERERHADHLVDLADAIRKGEW